MPDWTSVDLEDVDISVVLHVADSGVPANIVAGSKITLDSINWTRSTSSAFHRGFMILKLPTDAGRDFTLLVMGPPVSALMVDTNDSTATIEMTHLQAIYFVFRARDFAAIFN